TVSEQDFTESPGGPVGFGRLPQFFQRFLVDVLGPTTQQDCNLWQLATKTPNRVPHVGGTAGVKVGQADDGGAGDLQLRDIGRRKHIRRFTSRRQTVSVGKLRKQHRRRL